MKLDVMKSQAERIVSDLQPFAERIEIAGGIRREKPDPHDIEIVMIPKASRLFDLRVFLLSAGWSIKKGQVGGKYILFSRTPHSDQLDLFFARPDNWGLQLAIRTGSADFSHNVLATGWTRMGFHSINGMLRKSGQSYPIREEADLFRLLSIKWLPPQERTYMGR